jgi:hypothetical protein
MQKIAFWRSIGDAYAFVFGQPLRLLRIGGVWLAIFFLYSLWYVLPGAVARPTGLADALRDSGIELAALLFYLFGLISFAVAWHRAVLLNEDRTWLAALRFRRREWRFLGNGLIILLLIGLLVGVPLSVASWVFSIVLSAGLSQAHVGPGLGLVMAIAAGAILPGIGSAVWCRLALVFPAVAADAPGEPIAETWQQSRGNWLRLYFASLLCGLPVWALGWVVDRVSAGPLTRYSWTFAGDGKFIATYGGELQSALGLLVYFLEAAVLIAFYSIAYRQLPAPGAASSMPAPQPAE